MYHRIKFLPVIFQGASGRNYDLDTVIRSQTLSKAERKKGYPTGTMKLMSPHDEKTLETAVALANELTSRSMNDLGTDNKLPSSPSEKTKFHFKFPLVTLHHHHHHHSHDETHYAEKDTTSKQERRNFSEVANSVPDIQSTITEESKIAYTSLIEQPTPASALISQIATTSNASANPSTSQHKPSTIPKPARQIRPHFHSLQKQMPYNNRSSNNENHSNEANVDDTKNELPLPPRTTKPKLVDKPRHVRKYPLKLPNSSNQTCSDEAPAAPRSIIYQNTIVSPIKGIHQNGRDQRILIQGDKNGVDVFDGPEPSKVDTNPFISTSASSGASSANPFNCCLETIPGDDDQLTIVEPKEDQNLEEGSLIKDCTDHVSVEDLLEFADQKPCGRQRGVESDEVRIMCKVLKQQVTPVECLEALELCDWNVHHAIKVMRVKISVGSEQTALADCHQELINSGGDVVKASAVLVLRNQ